MHSADSSPILVCCTPPGSAPAFSIRSTLVHAQTRLNLTVRALRSDAAPVHGGLYGEYPSIEQKDWLYGEDLRHTIDFRGIYGTVLDQWLGIDPTTIVGGTFEQINPYKNQVA